MVCKAEIGILFKAVEGDMVHYGNYEGENEWIVLHKRDNKMLIISKNAIIKRKYNDEFDNTTWEKCSLRRWLNEDFYSEAFSDAEAEKILSVKLENKDNVEYGTRGGNVTTDKIFCLSIDEAKKYFKDSDGRMATFNGEGCCWWLRSPGSYSEEAARVDEDGYVDTGGIYVYDDSTNVRPVLLINLESKDA